MLAEIVSTTLTVLSILIFLRAIISWIPGIVDPRGPIAEFLITVTEPILAPIRSLMPRMMFDFSPMLAILLLNILARVVANNA
jgi:YggT family protein